MILTQISRPDALNEGQDRDDFSVGELTLVARHVAGRFAISFGCPKLSDTKKKLVGMMPRVTCLVMGRRFAAAIPHRAPPVGLAFEVFTMTGCAVGLVERRIALNGRLVIPKRPNCARRDGSVARFKHRPEQNQRVKDYLYSGQSIIPGFLRKSIGKSKALHRPFYPQLSAL